MESLSVMIESDLRDVPVHFVFNEINILEIGKEIVKRTTPSVVAFPCTTPEIPKKIGSARVVFLDTQFDLKKEKIAVIGCEISKKIFEEIFPGKEFKFYNICPRNTKINGNFIMRCCLRDKLGPLRLHGHEGFVVHWGATYEEILEGIKHILR
jgi:hypothetical protein